MWCRRRRCRLRPRLRLHLCLRRRLVARLDCCGRRRRAKPGARLVGSLLRDTAERVCRILGHLLHSEQIARPHLRRLVDDKLWRTQPEEGRLGGDRVEGLLAEQCGHAAATQVRLRLERRLGGGGLELVAELDVAYQHVTAALTHAAFELAAGVLERLQWRVGEVDATPEHARVGGQPEAICEDGTWQGSGEGGACQRRVRVTGPARRQRAACAGGDGVARPWAHVPRP